MKDNPLALDNQLCFALYSANRAMTALYRPHLDALGITYPQYLVLLVLWEAREAGQLPYKVTDIGEKLHLDTGTLTPLLKRMEAAGWIHRQKLREDTRVVGISLTEAGVNLKQQALSIPEKLLCQKGGSVEDIQQAKQVVEKLNCLLRGA